MSNESKELEEIFGVCMCRVESNDMVGCDVCEGWFHRSCIMVRAGVSLLEERDFLPFDMYAGTMQRSRG